MYTFEKNVFYKKPEGWEEHVDNTIFYYKELYADNSISILEDTGRNIQLKIDHTNLKNCIVYISVDNNDFSILYSNGSFAQNECPKVYTLKKYSPTPHITRGKKQILIVSLATPNMKAMTDISFKNHEHYALKHGYNYMRYFDTKIDLRYVTWNKVYLINELIHSFKYIIWIDADAIFTNPEITFESIINENKSKHLHVCDDIGGWRFNTGVMIWESCDWSKQVLKDWEAMEKIPHNRGAEQQQLINYLGKHDNGCTNWHVYNRKRFNAHPKDHCDGDFILHMMGMSGEQRIKCFSKWNAVLGI